MWALRKLGLLGRSTRTSIAGLLILGVLGSVVLWFVGLSRFRAQVHGEPFAPFPIFPDWVLYAQAAYSLAFLWLSVRRINDQDRPGWLALVPLILSILITAGLPIPASVSLLAALLWLILLLLPGTIGPNRYGPDPRGWKSREHYVEQQRRPGPNPP